MFSPILPGAGEGLYNICHDSASIALFALETSITHIYTSQLGWPTRSEITKHFWWPSQKANSSHTLNHRTCQCVNNNGGPARSATKPACHPGVLFIIVPRGREVDATLRLTPSAYAEPSRDSCNCAQSVQATLLPGYTYIFGRSVMSITASSCF
jgi:hypothetical protein